MSQKIRNVAAICAGVVLLSLPSAIFNDRLSGTVERQSQEELNLEARRTIALAETRIRQAISILDDLAARGINSCEPADLDALRQATFATTPVKEISVIDRDGNTLCSDLNGKAESRTVVSSEPAVRGGAILLEVVRVRDRPAGIVRIRRLGQDGANGVAALIPAELLVPQVSVDGGTSNTSYRIVSRSGAVISQLLKPPSPDDDRNALIAHAQSDRYAVDAVLALPRLSLSEREADMRALGAIVTGMLALIIFAFALMMPRRQHNNPVTAIEDALRAGEFMPYYQPIVDIRTGKLRGAEVLARWRKPDGTIVLPGTFIPLAESGGIILNLTRVLMRQAAMDLGRALAQRPHLKIGFNIIAQHFADEEIVNDISQAFKHSPLRLSQIVLEVTERQPIESLTETRRVIAALQGLGVQVAIDDVGTGHGGLSYMLKLGVDIIKIDKMFVDSIGVDGNSTAIVETLIDLAQSLRMEIVAEGVENFEQVVHLRNLGISCAQGHVFAPPLPSSSFIQLVEAIDPLPSKGSEVESPALAGELPHRVRAA